MKNVSAVKYSPSVLKQEKYPKRPLALIVDDEADICILLKDILQNKFESSSVTSLAAANQYLQTNEPALIFLDNKLSDGFGIENIHVFKLKYPATKIIMISACDNLNEREIALHEGADVFINKPFSIKTIWDAVQSMH